MLRYAILAITILLSAGCGESAPTGVEEETPLLTRTDFITRTEFDNYIASVQATIPNYNVMISEFSSISGQFAAGFIPPKWTVAYALNLVKRVEDLLDHARRIKPAHPELLKLHEEEYEAAYEDFIIAFSTFVQAVDRPGSVDTAIINDKIVEGNVHMIRLQILLGNLGGFDVDFFGPQGGDEFFPDEGEGFGF